MRGEGWRPYDEEAEIWQLGYRCDLEMWVWAGNYVQLQLALSVRTKAAGVRNPKMAILGDQSHYFLFWHVCILIKYIWANGGSRLSFAQFFWFSPGRVWLMILAKRDLFLAWKKLVCVPWETIIFFNLAMQLGRWGFKMEFVHIHPLDLDILHCHSVYSKCNRMKFRCKMTQPRLKNILNIKVYENIQQKSWRL